MRSAVGAAAALGLIVPGIAPAATPYFSMTVQTELGYDSSPFLSANSRGGSGTASIWATPMLTLQEATSNTTLAGRVGRVEYFKDYDAAESYSADLTRSQTFSEKLSGTAHVGVSRTTSALLAAVDDDAFARSNSPRTQYAADGSLNYIVDARSSIFISGNVQRSRYKQRNFGLSSNTSYGGTAGYSRQLNGRTSLGFTVGGSRVESEFYPDSTSIQPQLTLKHQFNARWLLDSAVGIIFQKTKFAGESDSTRSLGLQANLCGTYPLQTICFFASRDSSASGYGGPRIRTSVGASYSRELSARTSFSLDGSYNRDKSQSFRRLANNVELLSVTAELQHQLSERFSTGLNGSYDRRKFSGGTLRSADSIAGSVFLRVKLGRTR